MGSLSSFSQENRLPEAFFPTVPKERTEARIQKILLVSLGTGPKKKIHIISRLQVNIWDLPRSRLLAPRLDLQSTLRRPKGTNSRCPCIFQRCPLRESWLYGACDSKQHNFGVFLQVPSSQKKQKKQTTLHVHYAFLPSLNDCHLKLSNFTFYRARESVTVQDGRCSFSQLRNSSKKSTPAKFANVWHAERKCANLLSKSCFQRNRHRLGC